MAKNGLSWWQWFKLGLCAKVWTLQENDIILVETDQILPKITVEALADRVKRFTGAKMILFEGNLHFKGIIHDKRKA